MHKIIDVIKHLKKLGTWVDWDRTRDVVLSGSTEHTINKLGVCWVLTDKALASAIAQNIHFVITHENCFYFESTHQYRLLLESRNRKQALLNDHDITVYRCHDVWDYMPDYGIEDTFANLTGLPFAKRAAKEHYSYAHFAPERLENIAKKVNKALSGYGQDYSEILGDPHKMISSLAIGAGAGCNVFEMLNKEPVDCLMVSDDGACNWVEYQFCLDNDIALIIVHHSISEMAGMRNMSVYLRHEFPDLEIIDLNEGYRFTVVE